MYQIVVLMFAIFVFIIGFARPGLGGLNWESLGFALVTLSFLVRSS